MNQIEVNRIHDGAPGDSDYIASTRDGGFGLINELTKEEKRELLEMWKNRKKLKL